MTAFIFDRNTPLKLASNTFINTPIIWRHDEETVIEVVKRVSNIAAISSKIYDSDGAYLAKQIGTRIFPTAEGKLAALTKREFPDVSVLELNGRPLLELRRNGAAAVSLQAELYSRDATFVRFSNDTAIDMFKRENPSINIGCVNVRDSIFDCDIAFHTFTNGDIIIGEGVRSMKIGYLQTA